VLNRLTLTTHSCMFQRLALCEVSKQPLSRTSPHFISCIPSVPSFRSLSQYASGSLCIAIDLKPQVRSLKEELSKATALSGASAAVASAADSARSAAPPSPMLDALAVFGASTVGATAAGAAADTTSDTNQGIDRSGSVEAWVSEAGDGGDGLSPAE
ncbi:unnamed protein product, partial [Ectocarpus sp. 8 AP-2014]